MQIICNCGGTWRRDGGRDKRMEIESKSERECTKEERTSGLAGEKRGNTRTRQLFSERKRNYKEAKARARRGLSMAVEIVSPLSCARVPFFLVFPSPNPVLSAPVVASSAICAPMISRIRPFTRHSRSHVPPRDTRCESRDRTVSRGART